MLTGTTTTTTSSEAFKQTPSRQSHIPPKKQGFKLYERRNNNNNNHHNTKNTSLMINTLLSPRNNHINASVKTGPPEILSPSVLDFPSLSLLSPVTPLSNDVSSTSSSEEEERAIAEKGFYLHPSPRDAEPPQLLTLFPLTSPRVSGSTTVSSSSS
ncbi:hypothetical protein TIFTF001_023640 [Ficus carica]|uniref:VQ domain-containing protein n=1 Tax=Ficus carica TaxID=3494 RepID=A0AA88AUZ8_FICCA|nr:hypothetical protein TIFTF001_023640 [Ficus carica]